MRRFLLILLAARAAACGEGAEGAITAPGRRDAGGLDRGVARLLDAGVIADAEPPAEDAGPALDVGGLDMGPSDARSPDAGRTDTGGADGGGVDGGVLPPPPDPAAPGPHPIAPLATSVTARRSGNALPIDCRYPSDGRAGLPVVIIGHGFQIPATLYIGYAERLASFGYVACTVDFPAGLIADHVQNAEDLIDALDFVLSLGRLPGHVLERRLDARRIGIMGHSLGGKVAFMAADLDPRIGAVLGLDPVDGGALCLPGRCPDATAMLPFRIPVGVLGETLDGTSSLQACAPLADNFQTFYDAASTPALEVDVLGASHSSFVDDLLACGLPCALCNPATVSQRTVLDLARAFTVAFFERHLRGEAAYDTFLTGPLAQQRYVQTGRAAIRSK